MISRAVPTTYPSLMTSADCCWVHGLGSRQLSSLSWPSWGRPSSTGSSSQTSSSAQCPSYTITMWDVTKLIKKEYIVLKMRQQTLLNSLTTTTQSQSLTKFGDNFPQFHFSSYSSCFL